MEESTMKKYTGGELKKMPDLTDWDRVKKTQDSDIDFSDTPMATKAMLSRAVYPNRGRPVKEQKKKALTIRLDQEVVDAFKKTGPGWQTRINETLKYIINLRGLL
jgi:uncharacterized protein (DUF4415 family)